MRVLRVADVPRAPRGGMNGFMQLGGAAITAAGHDVEYLFSEDIGEFGSWPRIRWVWWPVRAAWRIATRRSDFDVAEIHEPAAAAYCALRRLRLLDRPRVVVLSHGLEELGWKARLDLWSQTMHQPRLLERTVTPYLRLPIIRFGLRNADHVVVLSEVHARYLTEDLGIPSNRVTIAPGGVHTSFGGGMRPTATSVAYAGSWLARKGTATLARAWERVLAEEPSATLTLLGTGLDEQTVLRDFEAGIRSSVRVRPRISSGDMAQELAQHSIYVSASTFEGMPLALLEAASCGCSCVVTAIAGHTDFFGSDPESNGGVLVRPNDAQELGRAVVELLRDSDRTVRLGSRAQLRAADYTWSANAGNLIQAYAAATETHRDRRRPTRWRPSLRR